MNRVVKNGAEDSFSIRSTRDGTRDAVWWADTCFLVHVLSDGDVSGLKAALLKIADGGVAVLIAGKDTVLSELCGRFVHLGYTLPDEGADPSVPPAGRPARLEAFQLTCYGIEQLPLFLACQQAQLGLHHGNPEPVEAFAGTFLGMYGHHRNLPAEALSQFRTLLTSRDNSIETAPGSPEEDLFRVYETLGIIEATAPYSWRPSLDATMNAPFLLDILLHQRREEFNQAPAAPSPGDAD